jgi:hypothetical protein
MSAPSAASTAIELNLNAPSVWQRASRAAAWVSDIDSTKMLSDAPPEMMA